MKLRYQILSIVLVSSAAVVATHVLYLWITYIDEIVVDGSAYGFHIGDSKSETYRKAAGALYGLSESGFSAPYIRIKVDKQHEEFFATRIDIPLLIQTHLHDVGYRKFSEQESWEFFIDGSYFNFIRLRFCGDELCEIYRHRKYFELP